MTVTYTYDKTIYFNGGLNTNQLHLMMRAGIPKYESLYSDGIVLYVTTSEELITEELDELNALIASYVYSEDSYLEESRYFIEPSVIYPIVNSNGYKRISTFRFPGSKYQIIAKVVLKSYVDIGRSYNIKLQNYDTGAVIYESTNLTNTSLDTSTFTTGFTNIPASEKYVNVLVKLNGANTSKNVYVEYVGIHLDQ